MLLAIADLGAVHDRLAFLGGAGTTTSQNHTHGASKLNAWILGMGGPTGYPSRESKLDPMKMKPTRTSGAVY